MYELSTIFLKVIEYLYNSTGKTLMKFQSLITLQNNNNNNYQLVISIRKRC